MEWETLQDRKKKKTIEEQKLRRKKRGTVKKERQKIYTQKDIKAGRTIHKDKKKHWEEQANRQTYE